jgi:hypothetical protein
VYAVDTAGVDVEPELLEPCPDHQLLLLLHLLLHLLDHLRVTWC